MLESDDTCPLGRALRNWDPKTVRGIAVDPVDFLLRQLLELPCVSKVAVALGVEDGMMVCTHVQEDAGKRYPHSYGGWFARGAACVGNAPRMHSQLKEHLE